MKYVSTVLFALYFAAGAALAVDKAPPSTSGHAQQSHADHTSAKPGSNQAFATFDANKDGKLSKAELAKHPMAGHMSMVDADKDGSLNAAEFAALEKM